MSTKQEPCNNKTIPISEWPIISSNSSQLTNAHNVQSIAKKANSCSARHISKKQKISHTTHSPTSVTVSALSPMLGFTFDNEPESPEPLIAVRVAKWLRKSKEIHLTHLLAGCTETSANTKLFNLSKTKECVEFLQAERNYLLLKSKSNQFKHRCDIYAALASIEDWLQNYSQALKHIKLASALSPENEEYLWLKKKIQKQCKAQDCQILKIELFKNVTHSLPDFNQVERISCKDLSVEDFFRKYVDSGKPVIILDILQITKTSWDFDYIKSVAGSQKVTVKQSVAKSVEWAQLEDSCSILIADFIDAVQENKTSEYLFDWSLPLHCPDLAKEFVTPDYFEDNFLLKTSPGTLYHDSWPSLFIAPQGVNSGLHIDAFASNFWMILFQGQKRWTFYDTEDVPLLYPVYFHSTDPVFCVNLSEPDLEKFPLLSLTKPRQCTLNPGELLFVPSGSPHFVENLTPTLAVSSNHVSFSNFKEVCKELKINGLNDPRSKDLLQQFEDPQFLNRISLK
ncbi:hypothetical protein Btru_035960 [Bulinus truncatus]|nr:hypothetical protein Btru_035960 [Bulinus truncatus]